MEKFSRRFFLGGCAALAGARVFAANGFRLGKVNLRLGVLSDVHVHDAERYDSAHLVRAFEYFRDNGADGVIIAGDIADRGLVSELKYFAAAWYKVFPNDTASDGRHVEKLFVYGNHDVLGWTWTDQATREKPEHIANAIGYSEETRARVWEECFHEKYEPIWIKDVKGYKVVGRHWKYDDRLEEFLKAHADELKGPRPFFYAQHDHPRNTCFDEWAWGHDDGTSTRLLSQFPNCVAFSGHSHYTLTDERTVWQGAFTSINTSSMRYSSTDYNLRDNFRSNSGGYQGWNRSRVTPSFATDNGKQGMLLEIGDEAIVIRRREFVWNESLGDDWVLPLPAAGGDSLSYASRAAKRSAPAFPKDAEVKVSRVKDEKAGELVEVAFPAADPVDGCRVFEYEVAAILCEDGLEMQAITKRVIATDFHLPASQCGKPGVCRFTADELPPKARLRFEVRPIECFGKKGAAIVSPTCVP